MSLNFNRKAEVFVFPVIAAVQEGAEPLVGPLPQGIRITDLRISFQIEKNSESNANKASISIFNLSETTRSKFLLQGQKVILNVGYAGQFQNPVLETIFRGDIRRAVTSRPDSFVTTIECGDAEVAIEETHIEKTFAKGVTVKSAIQSILGLFKRQNITVNNENISDLIKNSTTFVSSLNLSGPVKSIMDNLTKKLGLEWNVQDEQVHIRIPNKVRNTNAIVLNSKTGLLNVPIKREDGGVDFMSLLIPKIKPNATVKIESDVASGFFNVRKVSYKGDTRSDDWTIKGEAFKDA